MVSKSPWRTPKRARARKEAETDHRPAEAEAKAAQEAGAREEIEVTEVDLVEEVAQDPEQESPGSALTESQSSSSTRDQEKDSKERPEETIPTTSTPAPAENQKAS